MKQNLENLSIWQTIRLAAKEGLSGGRSKVRSEAELRRKLREQRRQAQKSRRD